MNEPYECPNCGYVPEKEEKDSELIKKILSLSFQEKHDEAEKLSEQLDYGPFEIGKDITKKVEKLRNLLKENKQKEAIKLIKNLKKKGINVNVKDYKKC